MARSVLLVRGPARTVIALAAAVALAAASAGCGHPAPVVAPPRPGPRLGPPPPADPSAFGHAYLEAVGARLGRDWSAFLEDLRLRLPPGDPLNDARLVVQLDCAIGRDGAVGDVRVTASGQGAFDRAAVELVRDAAPLPAPPDALVSDDDTVHLHWQFARDRRQAGIATARIERVLWPIDRAVPKLVAAGDLAEAARRIAGATADAHAADAAERVFVAAIDEGVHAKEVTVRREASAAALAIRSPRLAASMRELVRGAFDLEVRLHAVAAIGAVKDAAGVALMDELLGHGPDQAPELTAAAARALDQLGAGDHAVRAALAWLVPVGGHAPERAEVVAALAALREVAAPSTVPAVRRLLASPDPMTRAAACTALARSVAGAGAWAGIERGLADRDATVRAICAAAAAAAGAPAPRTIYPRLLALARDRDDRVRAAAALAAAAVDGRRAAGDLRGLPAEKSAAGRSALAAAWGRVAGPTPAPLVALAGDTDPAVRAAAVAALAGRDDADARALAARMAPDPDPRVRLAAIGAVTEPDALAGFVTDDDPQVRGAALDRDAQLRGRAGALVARATALAAAPPASMERVRIARSWLLAP